MTKQELRKHLNKHNKTKGIKIPKFINKILFTIFIFLVTIIVLKNNQNFKQIFYQKVYTENLSFAVINKMYQKYLGEPIPFNIFKGNAQSVFNEKLMYIEKIEYLNGVSLKVDNNYLVPSLDNGIIIFIGEKEGYGNTIIMECENGVEVWYGNIDNENVKMYDYIIKGSLIGEVNEKLYLLFMKDGEILDYEDYI